MTTSSFMSRTHGFDGIDLKFMALLLRGAWEISYLKEIF